MKKFVLIVVLIGFALSISGGFVLADVFDTGGTLPDIESDAELLNKVSTAADWVFTVLLVLSVFAILMAAFQFVTGGPEGVSEARQKLIWAVVGIGLALLAKGIPTVIVSILG